MIMHSKCLSEKVRAWPHYAYLVFFSCAFETASPSTCKLMPTYPRANVGIEIPNRHAISC